MGSFPKTYDDHIPSLLEYQGQIQKMWPLKLLMKKGISKETNNTILYTFFGPINLLQGNKKGILIKKKLKDQD